MNKQGLDYVTRTQNKKQFQLSGFSLSKWASVTISSDNWGSNVTKLIEK